MNSNNGMSTYIWGPSFWHVLHTISFNYPINPTEKHKKDYFKYIKSLENILPCKYCRDNIKKNFKEDLPLTINVFKNRNTFSKYIYDLHELINKNLNKKSNLSFKQVKDRYESFRAQIIDPSCCIEIKNPKYKCILNIVPKDEDIPSFNTNVKCIVNKKK